MHYDNKIWQTSVLNITRFWHVLKFNCILMYFIVQGKFSLYYIIYLLLRYAIWRAGHQVFSKPITCDWGQDRPPIPSIQHPKTSRTPGLYSIFSINYLLMHIYSLMHTFIAQNYLKQIFWKKNHNCPLFEANDYTHVVLDAIFDLMITNFFKSFRSTINTMWYVRNRKVFKKSFISRKYILNAYHL